jgi:replicative superfamily II helicase
MENLPSSIGIIAVHFEKMSNMMEKREKDRARDRELKNNIWDIIKDIPNLDDKTRFKIAELMKSKTNKDLFLKMSQEDHLSWLKFKLGDD